MIKLIPYELGKIWCKRSFQVFTFILLVLNLFLNWYLNIPKEDMPPLSAYKAVCTDVSGMSESEKLKYIAGLKEKIDGVSLVGEVLNMQSHGDETGTRFAKQLRDENPGVFEKYIDVYNSGGYLTYTDSLYKEKALLDELYTEIEKVSDYDAYLVSIQQNKESLSGISIFADASKDSYSSRNIEKSAADHASLSSDNIRWYPSKGFTMATRNGVTDIFLLLSVFLFVGGLITQEKEKGLFYITRATKNGIAACIGAKLIALLLHCITICVLLCGSNILYAGLTTGLCDFSASIQSIASFIQSSLSINLLEYTVFCILTKGMILFCIGIALSAVSICSAKSFVPHLIGVGWIAVNWFAYTLIPAYSTLNPLKYLSLFGLMKTEHLYGEYLNFNIAEYAVPRHPVALILIGMLCSLGVSLSFLLFGKGKSLAIRKTHISSLVPFRPHGNLLLYEGYKILFTNRAIIILLLFAVLIGYGNLGKSYSPSVNEQYYRDMMLMLEGELTDEKEVIISVEQARYDEAFAQIERIDKMVASNKIDEHTGENMKSKWYGEISFYTSFQRVLQQYEHIRENGGVFVYDTGYRYLFGTMDDRFLIDFLLLSLCMVFAFSNVMAMEYQKTSWAFLSATAKGKRQIIQNKILICTICAALMALLPWLFRMISISEVYPMHEWFNSVKNIPLYYEFGMGIPLWSFFVLACLFQITAIVIVGAIVLFISWRCKNYLQILFFALLVLAVPIVLTVIGIDFTRWFSLYPLYSWVSGI